MTTIEKARQVAAQAWCDPETSGKVMDPVLCESFARRLAVALDHLSNVTEVAVWMSGSGDFSMGGQAGAAWAKVRPAVQDAVRYVTDPAAPPPRATAAPDEDPDRDYDEGWTAPAYRKDETMGEEGPPMDEGDLARARKSGEEEACPECGRYPPGGGLTWDCKTCGTGRVPPSGRTTT